MDFITCGWIGNAFILIAALRLSKKHRSAFLFYMIGGLLWFTEATMAGMVDLMAIESVMFFVYLRNFWKWGKHE